MTSEATLEQVLKDEGQVSKEEVKEEVTDEEVEKSEVQDKPEKPDAFESRVQAEVDKRTNAYREKREADSAYNRSLKEENRRLKSEQTSKKIAKLGDLILAGDKEDGLGDDKIEARRQSLKEISSLIENYDEKSAEIEETAQFITTMTENLPPKVIKEFGLDDANPNIRASNGVKFLDEVIGLHLHNQNFLLVFEHFLPKGGELREELEDIVNNIPAEDSENSKIRYIKDRLQGVKVNRKKPATSSDGSGGGKILKGPSTASINITEGLKEEREKLKI